MATRDWSDSESVASSVAAASEVSTVPDKFGFLGGAQYSEDCEETVPVDVIRRREKKMAGDVQQLGLSHAQEVQEGP